MFTNHNYNHNYNNVSMLALYMLFLECYNVKNVIFSYNRLFSNIINYY